MIYDILDNSMPQAVFEYLITVQLVKKFSYFTERELPSHVYTSPPVRSVQFTS